MKLLINISIVLALGFIVGKYSNSGINSIYEKLRFSNKNSPTMAGKYIPNNDCLDELSSALPYAKAMLQKICGSEVPFSRNSVADTAKYLNHLVFVSWSSNNQSRASTRMNDLFESLDGACGARAYVLRGLLAVHSIKSRFSNLYNLPGQGNHTLVEVEISAGKWALFDPTYGVFFTQSGNADDAPLSLDEVRFLDKHSLKQHVLVAKKTATSNDIAINKLYGKDFDYPCMQLENYVLAEKSSAVGVSSVVPLVLSINISKGETIAGSSTFTDLEGGRIDFLRWSNGTLNNTDPTDDVSYLFHIVGRYSPYFQSINIIELKGLHPDSVYEIYFYGYTKKRALVQLTTIGRDSKLSNSNPELVAAGKFKIDRQFKAAGSVARFLFSLNDTPGESYIYLFGLEVKSQYL